MIVVLNFGSQFAHLIARRVRDMGVRAEILPYDASPAEILRHAPEGIILSGSPASVLDKKTLRPQAGIFKMGLPILGICYGQQVMAHMLGGKVVPGTRREFGKEHLSVRSGNGIFGGWRKEEVVWFSHGDQVAKLPPGFARLASTPGCPNAAMGCPEKKMWAIQFHPEVSHTTRGTTLLRNFVMEICGAKKDWKIAQLAPELIESVRKTVGKDHVLIGISGGVDSLVAATLLHKAIGKPLDKFGASRLHAVFVDTGLLRKNEVSEVQAALRKEGFRNLLTVPAGELFLSRLKRVTDPEAKRKAIGHTFIEVFERTIRKELKKYPIKYLAQGTIYPDRIESAEASKHASKIKSHHNLTLPEKLGFKILEPLRDLYKDEVRRLGEFLGLPHAQVWRHPFPGPGLAIRIVGEVTPDKLRILQEADAIYIEELRKTGEYEKIWQAFAALLSLKVVGVMGDARTYEYILALRAVDSVDGMTADWHKLPLPLLERISTRIVGEVRGINRVMYDVTQKPPGTIEYE